MNAKITFEEGIVDVEDDAFVIKVSGGLGPQGLKGNDGNDGNDGISITTTVLNSDYTLTIFFSDGSSYTTKPIRGEQGHSPVITASKSGDTTTLFVDGNPLATISDGTKGDTGAIGPVGPQGPKGDDYTLTSQDKEDIAGMVAIPVTDVQVAGASVVNNGVAEIPVAENNGSAGVIALNSNYGVTKNSGALAIVAASSAKIKNGATGYAANTPIRQHESTFYGLAKVAGHDEKDSSLPVGQYTDEAKSAIQDMLDVPAKSDIPTIPVTDVQINGSSIVSDGLAEIPLATTSGFGVVKINTGQGIGLDSVSKTLFINKASDGFVKAGTSYYVPIVPVNQHNAVFYGLAKAAGYDEKDSTLPAGQYSTEAIVAIQKMLGLYREWELISDVTVQEDTALYEITEDISGQPFSLLKMRVMAWLQPALTEKNDYFSANVLTVTTSGTNQTISAPTKQYQGNGATTFAEYLSEVMCGVVYTTSIAGMSPNTSLSVSAMGSNYDNTAYYRGFRLSQYSSTATLIPAGTRIKLYGIRI